QEFKTSFIDKIQPAIKHSPEALFLIEVTDIKIDFLTTDFNFVDEHLHETSQTLSKHLQDFKNPTKAYFYRVRMEFYKHYDMSTEFYETALSYLRYEDIESLRPNDRLILGTDICKAALVGKIYAPEKLINHPIITDLQQTAEKWLYVALKAMNECDIEKFEAALFNDQVFQ
ncbi:26S proteasome non-ATPase regulatory subunit 13, partial [Bonamia ostreae]